MSAIHSEESERGGSESRTFTRDVVLDILSNERRRYVVHYLKRVDSEAGVSDVAEHVACWELDKPLDRLDYKERKRVKNALRQFHLPKMEEAGFVEFDRRSGTVRLSRQATKQDFYVDVLPTRGIPWGLYYLGLSVLGIGVMAYAWFGFGPPTGLPTHSLCLAFVVGVFVSSMGHFYDNYYRMRLGAGATPPGVTDR